MGMPEESEPTEYRKGVIMKKHRIISIALSVIGIAATVSLAVYLLKDRIKGCPFCGNNSSDEPEEDIFDSDLDDLEEFVPVEKEEKPSSQTKIRRGYIPLKFHSHEEEEALFLRSLFYLLYFIYNDFREAAGFILQPLTFLLILLH